MLKMLLSVLCILLTCVTMGRSYYVSASGRDENAGNKLAPWKSIDKVNAFHFNAGDSILFNRGDSFYGTLNCQSGNKSQSIVYGAYGTGKFPVISGFKTINEWTDKGNGIYESRNIISSLPTLAMVTINGRCYAMGRFPNGDEENGGFITITSHEGNKLLRLSKTIAGDYSGGVVVIRKKRWVFDRNRIESNSSFSINYSPLPGSAKQYDPEDGYGAFIQDHPRTLDQYGEWCYRDGKLLVYSNKSPTEVKAAAVQAIVRVKGFVILEQLRFEGANDNAVEATGAGIEIKNCEIFFAGKNAINVSSGRTSGMKILNNNIQFSNNCAISTYPGEFINSLVQGNYIANNGLIAGAGESGDLGQEAIRLFGSGNRIELNHIVNSGYTGIRFSPSKNVGGNNIISRNYIDSFCLVKDDGAGIYTWNNSPDRKILPAQKVSDNIILNAIGNSNGTKSTRPEAYGIYIDDNASGIEVTGNTVANTYFGIFNHNGHHCHYLKNTLYNNHAQAVWSRDREIAVEGLKVEGNIFFSKANQNTARFWDLSGVNTIASFGSFDNNFYCNPYAKEGASINVIEPRRGGLNNTFTLEQWQAASQYGSKDRNSKGTATRSKEYLVFNASNKVKAFPLKRKCIDLKGNVYMGSVKLHPFTSLLLFEAD